MHADTISLMMYNNFGRPQNTTMYGQTKEVVATADRLIVFSHLEIFTLTLQCFYNKLFILKTSCYQQKEKVILLTQYMFVYLHVDWIFTLTAHFSPNLIDHFCRLL